MMTSNGMQALTDRERMYHGKYTGVLRQLRHAERRAQDALRRAQAAEAAHGLALAEIARLRGSGERPEAIPSYSAPVEFDDDDALTVTDIELTRLRRLIGELRAEDEERHAAVICKALDAVSRIHDEVFRVTGRRKRTGRDMGPYRRQEVKA